MKEFEYKDGKLICREGGKIYEAKEGSKWVSASQAKHEIAKANKNPYPIGSTESFMRELFK